MKWSKEQEAIFKHFAESKENAVVQARAGTGKTTTIKEAFNHAPERRMLYAVFNKKNQIEAAEKIKNPRVDVLTLHSLGFRFIKKVWPNAKPDDAVESDRARVALTKLDLGADDAALSATTKLVGFLKNLTITPTQADATQIATEREIINGDMPKRDDAIVLAALDVLELSKTQDLQNRISFSDMVWLPVAMNWVRAIYDLVCVDEAQDMNLPQLTMARQSSKGRVIVVGDDRQCIYSFRGAVQNGLEMMRVQLNAVQLSLTTTYRCPKAVVALARTEVPDYQAHETAPEGEVAARTEKDLHKDVAVGDAVLSRLNAPLMPLCLNLLRKNIPARIEGRDIGKQLITLVGKVSKIRLSGERKAKQLVEGKCNEVDEFILKLAEYEEREIRRVSAWKNAEKKVEQIQDIVATLGALAADCNTVNEIARRLETLFQDTTQYSKSAVVLSSVHKAKGLEWKRVWMLESTFRRGKGGEEANIYYVAVTRAQNSLFLVNGKGKEEKIINANPTTTTERAPITTLTWAMPAMAA